MIRIDNDVKRWIIDYYTTLESPDHDHKLSLVLDNFKELTFNPLGILSDDDALELINTVLVEHFAELETKVIPLGSISKHGVASPKAYECQLYAEREGLALSRQLDNLVNYFGLEMVQEMLDFKVKKGEVA